MFRNIKKRLSRGGSNANSASSLEGEGEDGGGGTNGGGDDSNNQHRGRGASDQSKASSSLSASSSQQQQKKKNSSASGAAPVAAAAAAATAHHHQHQHRGFQAAGKALGQNIKASLKNKQQLMNHQRSLERTTAADQLSRFDACVEATDALTASASTSMSSSERGTRSRVLPPRTDEKSGLSDCSVLVSPDGDLLLVPQNDDQFKELMENSRDEYESAIFLGNDLVGDRALNGFTAVGWSIPATTAALQQTMLSFQHGLKFTESLVLAKKEFAAQTAVACNDFRHNAPPDWELLDCHHDELLNTVVLPSSQQRVGPMCSPTSTINTAICELEKYHFGVAELDSQRWRKHSAQRQGCLVALRQAEAAFGERCRRRQDAIHHTAARVRKQEEEITALQARASEAWDAVYKAEDDVTHRVETIMQKRSREREKQRLEQIKQQHDVAFGTVGSGDSIDKASTHSAISTRSGDAVNPSATTGGAAPTPTLGATNEEIWNLVSAVAESMEDGSFEPMVDDLPGVPLSIPRDKSMDEDDNASKASSTHADQNQTSGTDDTAADTASTDNSKEIAAPAPVLAPTSTSSMATMPVVSREQIELEVGLPQLRAAAMACDEMVADAADALMNLLTALDTTRRSARVAAETSLLSACNAQAACLKSLVQLERESLQERLRELESLEEVVEKVDVRSDINAYINADKRERGGMSALGDDDDGGIASALAILSRHVDGSLGYDPTHRMTHDDDTSDPDSQLPDHSERTVTKMLDRVLDGIFDQDAADSSLEEMSDAVEDLCKIVSDVGPMARTKRSKICYALNSKRSSRAEIASQPQFDVLCRLFSAILTGCNAEEGGVSNAKMCIMLAQTFYVVSKENGAEEIEQLGNESPPRAHRIYVKNFLKEHKIWGKDDFWDQALSQQISESLTHSGVMANFEKSRAVASRDRKNSEWTETRKTKWYDLTHKERIQAASQVQAVVFAQLGALAHSMMELGCGLERSCAFVRRMSIRHQLPSSQRTMLLQHLISRDDLENGNDNSGESTAEDSATKNKEGQVTDVPPPPPKDDAEQEVEDNPAGDANEVKNTS